MNRIIVMAKNEVGVLADISQALADEGINIETISAEGLADQGVITLSTDNHDDALRVLMNAGYKAVSDDSLILRLPDEPGALAKVAGQVQGRRREYPEPAHRGAPGRPHHRSPRRRGQRLRLKRWLIRTLSFRGFWPT